MTRWTFPRWSDRLRVLIPALTLGGGAWAVLLVWLGASPRTTDVGYQPEQPLPFSHALHAGDLQVDCRFCHAAVERAPHATLPSTETCMACHARVKADSPALALLRESAASGWPVPWVRVHDLPDYAWFDHAAHVLAGVGCDTCHGRVDRMRQVWQVEPLSMSWCLDCHRDPAPRLRPPERVTDMAWVAGDDARAAGAGRMAAHGIAPPEDCAACHR